MPQHFSFAGLSKFMRREYIKLVALVIETEWKLRLPML